MSEINCAKCPAKYCYPGDYDFNKLPSFCPMRTDWFKPLLEESLRTYKEDEKKLKLARAAAFTEKEGYCVWPRIREVAEFAKRLGVERIGIAFCIGLSDEAKKLVKIYDEWGFKVNSVCCKCGAVDKSELGIPEEKKLRRGYESMCNPILQAKLLNHAGTELNLIVGLCVGHDSLFLQHSRAPVVTLITKDRVTGHSPATPLYTSYHQKLLKQE